MYYVIIIIISLLVIFYFTNASYYLVYTADYLLHRNEYNFKEEAQFKDNSLKQNDYFLTSFMKNYRNRILEKMPILQPMQLPEININELSNETCAKISHNFTQPFVIRGLIKNFECVKKWDLNYFEEEYGNIEVPAFSVTDETVSYSKNSSTSIKKCNNSNFCSIKTICQSIRIGEPLYINNISKLFTESDKARGELNLDKMSEIMNQSFLTKPKQNEFMSQLFLGGKNTGTSLHCASNINFFFNVKGKKHWGFIDSKYTHLVNCQTSRQGLFAICSDDFFDKSENNAFSKIPRYETVLNSGDFLFNPAWYWHAVKNKSDYTIAVANRYVPNDMFGSEIQIPKNNYFFTFLQLFSPLYYLKFFFTDKNKSTQDKYGSIVDKEIIDNLSQNEVL
jgi:hypothetical protein